MNPKHTPAAPPTITLGDVYYILFRHKWLIIALVPLAIIAAIGVRVFWPVPYQSEAKLLIKYVRENRPPEQGSSDSQLTLPDRQGETVINSEIEILTSMDLATNVVDLLTPTRILARAGGGTNAVKAALLIKAGLKPEEPNRSDVITLVFSFPDPDMVQPILRQIIDSYLREHTEIHRPEFNDFLTRETDTVKRKLDDTEAALQEAKGQNHIMSIDDSKKQIGDMMAKVQQQIYDAQAEAAGYNATIREMQKLVPPPIVAPTNKTVSSQQGTTVSPDKIRDYQELCTQISSLESTRDQLLHTYKPGNTLVVQNQAEIDTAEAQKKQMEDKNPGLIAMKPVDTKGSNTSPNQTLDPQIALNEEIIKADALAARIKVLTNQLAEIRNNAAAVIGQEGTIAQLQRDKEIQEAEFTYYSRKLEESRADEAQGPGNSNISVFEGPTPPSQDTRKVTKAVAGVLLGGLALAFGLPFLIELYLDRSLKRPLDVQSKLGLPVFVSVPWMNGNGKAHSLKGAKKVGLLAEKTNGAAPSASAAEPAPVGEPANVPRNGPLAVWEKGHMLQPFYETLRDRLMAYFEMINLTHKPKLVAVTSCSQNAGVTTTAASLASSLSETGDGNVLLVNMNVRDSATHRFYKGKLACGLDEVLEKETRNGALVQGNLYVASELDNDDKLPRILPKRFSHLLPKMKASDFDYIIFDMPPVNQTSITSRLARFMDMVLLVVESGKTDQDVARRVAATLSDSKTNVGIVLNKNRSYGPRHHHDI